MSSKFRPGTLSAYVYDLLVADSSKPLHKRRTDTEIINSSKQIFRNHKISRNSVRMYRSLSRKHAPASVEITSSQDIVLERRRVRQLLA